jgi:hypothetical protein
MSMPNPRNGATAGSPWSFSLEDQITWPFRAFRAGHGDDAALAYMRERALAAHMITRLSEHSDRYFADQAAWAAHLEKLGIAALKVNPDPTPRGNGIEIAGVVALVELL